MKNTIKHNKIIRYPKFEKFLYDLGAKSVKSQNFEINIDIPNPQLIKWEHILSILKIKSDFK